MVKIIDIFSGLGFKSLPPMTRLLRSLIKSIFQHVFDKFHFSKTVGSSVWFVFIPLELTYKNLIPLDGFLKFPEPPQIAQLSRLQAFDTWTYEGTANIQITVCAGQGGEELGHMMHSLNL